MCSSTAATSCLVERKKGNKKVEVVHFDHFRSIPFASIELSFVCVAKYILFALYCHLYITYSKHTLYTCFSYLSNAQTLRSIYTLSRYEFEVYYSHNLKIFTTRWRGHNLPSFQVLFKWQIEWKGSISISISRSVDQQQLNTANRWS